MPGHPFLIISDLDCSRFVKAHIGVSLVKNKSEVTLSQEISNLRIMVVPHEIHVVKPKVGYEQTFFAL